MDIDFKATVLVVAGATERRVAMAELLQARCHVMLAHSGADAIRAARQTPVPDLVLLSGCLTDMDAGAVLRAMTSHFFGSDVAIIVMSAPGQCVDDETRALRDGAADVVPASVTPALLLARVALHMELRRSRALLRERERHLAHLVADSARAATQMQDATVLAMASLAESRDPDITNHIRRTQHYVAALAHALRFHANYTSVLGDDTIALLFKAAPLHDIGKVGVADAILFKEGKLTDSEFEQMKLHTVYGRDAIAGVERTLGASNAFLRLAREITWSHHEHWDGSGYPQGLAGTAIPLSARLMAVADVYDALICERRYRPAFTHETAVELIRQGRGEHFDPDVVDVMLAIEDKFRAIAARFSSGAHASVVPQRQL